MKREALGEDIWTTNVPAELRQKILWLLERHGRRVNEYSAETGMRTILSYAHHYLTRSIGVETLHGGQKPHNDMQYHIKNAKDSEYPDILESLCVGYDFALQQYISKDTKKEMQVFQADINELLESYKLSYTVENGQVTDFASRELHMEVVSPALHLLKTEGWEDVEQAYQEALKELARKKPDNAITDATTALQVGLRKLGCKGDSFESLVKSAKNTILQGYDARYVGGLEKLVDWASAVRANKGDGHKVVKPTPEDAWFIVHLVGALLLYLAKKHT